MRMLGAVSLTRERGRRGEKGTDRAEANKDCVDRLTGRAGWGSVEQRNYNSGAGSSFAEANRPA